MNFAGLERGRASSPLNLRRTPFSRRTLQYAHPGPVTTSPGADSRASGVSVPSTTPAEPTIAPITPAAGHEPCQKFGRASQAPRRLVVSACNIVLAHYRQIQVDPVAAPLWRLFEQEESNCHYKTAADPEMFMEASWEVFVVEKIEEGQWWKASPSSYVGGKDFAMSE